MLSFFKQKQKTTSSLVLLQIKGHLAKELILTIKNMKKDITAIIATLLLFAPVTMWAQIDTRPYITQNTTCEKKVTPDELYLSITINEKDNKGKKSVELLQKEMIQALESLGINVEKNLTLNYMGSEISYTTFRRNVTPRTSATYMLKIGNAETMQKVINKLEAQGITNIELARTNYSKEDEIYNELATEAMKKAKQQATTLAEAIGQSIGPAISITSNKYSGGNAMPRLYKARNMMMVEESADMSIEEPQIEVGKITYTFNVNVKFLLNEASE